MADLSFGEKQILENWLEMKSGYVLDFTNTTFQEIVFDASGIDIYHEKYQSQGKSKANLLRSFWQKESSQMVYKLLSTIEVYWRAIMKVPLDGHVNLLKKDYQNSLKTIERLKNEMASHVEAINTSIQDESFDKAKNSISQLIEQNRPDEAIDRLHTYLMMYIKKRLEKHCFTPSSNATLHGLIGLYKNQLLSKGVITVGMTEEIFRVCSSLADKFNNVRNNHSMAHANTLLNYPESKFIYKVTASMIEFIESVDD